MPTWDTLLDNQLVDRTALNNAVTNNIFPLKPGQTVPTGTKCVNITEATTWLTLNELYMPTDGSMPRKINFAANPPECTDKALVFQICNENSAKDDNFDIYLNGHYIGAVDLNADAQIGSVFIASLDTSLEITDPDFACPMVGMVAYYFDPAYVIGGHNVISMVNTQNNGNGNAGTIGVRNYTVSGSDLITPCVVADLTYTGPSGENFEADFDYQACCVVYRTAYWNRTWNSSGKSNFIPDLFDGYVRQIRTVSGTREVLSESALGGSITQFSTDFNVDGFSPSVTSYEIEVEFTVNNSLNSTIVFAYDDAGNVIDNIIVPASTTGAYHFQSGEYSGTSDLYLRIVPGFARIDWQAEEQASPQVGLNTRIIDNSVSPDQVNIDGNGSGTYTAGDGRVQNVYYNAALPLDGGAVNPRIGVIVNANGINLTSDIHDYATTGVHYDFTATDGYYYQIETYSLSD